MKIRALIIIKSINLSIIVVYVCYFSGKEFDQNYSFVTNNNGDKINASYHLLNTENTEKQYLKICQGKYFVIFNIS